MKKLMLSIFSTVFLFSCSDTGIEVVSNADYSTNISYQVGSPRDKRLTFFDVNEFKQIRTIPNNLSSGDLQGRVQFAQTHTIDPNNNESRKEPSLIPYRAALLLFTPQVNLSSLQVTATYIENNTNKSINIIMNPPINMPNSDYNNNGSKKDITYSKRSWSAQLPYYAVMPEMQLKFTAKTKDGLELTGTILGEDIEFAAPLEGVFLLIRLGMLTDKVAGGRHAMTTDTAHALQEYFQTVPFAQLSAGVYEDMILNKVILSSGKIYEGKSDYVGADYYSGDMREDVAKAQVSVGIDSANKGIVDSALNQNHEINHDMFYFTVHHVLGRYTDEKGSPVDVQHGLSGGNGIGTLVDSVDNEFSHEVGHGYNMGHYPNSNESADGSIHGYSTSWGYDAYKNRMRANVAWNSKPDSYMFQDKYYITPFQETYGWNKDSMAGGWADSAISRYTHNTARSTRQIQKNIEGRYFLSDSKNNNGEYYYIGWDKSAREYKNASEENFNNKRINPVEKGVPVITILGGYDPKSPYNAVLYPYFRSNWGNVFASIFRNSLPAGTLNYLEITYYAKPTQYIVLNSERYNSNIINKLHFNIAESDRPKTISLYVNNTLKGSTTIAETVYNTPLKKAVVIGKGKGYEDVINEDAAYLETNLAGKTVDNYTLTAKEKELIEILYRFSALNKLSAPQKAVAENYINNKNKTDKINIYIEDNYTLLENNDISADETLKKLLAENNLGVVEFKFNQAEINGRCMEVYESEESKMSVRASAVCSDTNSQRWAIDKYGRIHSALYPGYCLEQGKMAVLQLCSDNAKQQWKIRNSDIENGVVYENIGSPNQCIDNSASQPEKIIAYACSGAGNQKFKNKISEDNNIYFGLFNGSLIEEIWKYIPAERGENQ